MNTISNKHINYIQYKYNFKSAHQLHSIWIQLQISTSTTFNMNTISIKHINYIQYKYNFKSAHQLHSI